MNSADDHRADHDGADLHRTDDGSGALSVLREGIRRSPELRSGLPLTVGLGIGVALSSIASPVLIQLAIDRGGLASGDVNLGTVYRLVAAAGVIMLTAAALRFIVRTRLIRRAEAALRRTRVELFSHVHRMSIAAQQDQRTGVLVSRLTSDVEALSRFVDWGLFTWIVQPLLIVAVLIAMAVYSWPLAIVAALVFGLVIPTLRFFQRQTLISHNRLRDRVASVLAAYSEALGGAATVRAYRAQRFMRDRLVDDSSERYRAGVRANMWMALVYVVGDLLSAVVLAGIVTIGYLNRAALDLSSGDLAALIMLTTLLSSPIGELGETINNAQEAVAGWRRILTLLDRPVDVAEDGTRTAASGALSVEAAGVSFAYGDGAMVLRDVTIDIPSGARVAIVGETGSGKSTFARLLCRLADPTDGVVRLGGVPIEELSAASRQRAVRFVPQDGFLFDTSIRENIRFGRDGATDADVDAAIALLGLEDWVAGLTRGLDTAVGERGSNLSVGERQLVAFARAAVADPGVLVLDEATSSVDPLTDQGLTRSLRRLARGRTVVSVAHRLATAEESDLVIVFHDGEIVESGTPGALARSGGRYADLLAVWNRHTAA